MRDRSLPRVGTPLLLVRAISLLIGGSLGAALASIEVGSTNRPGLLPQEIVSAYQAGHARVTIRPGTYLMPDSGEAPFPSPAPPPGGTERPIVGCGFDGVHTTSTHPGIHIESCVFEGVWAFASTITSPFTGCFKRWSSQAAIASSSIRRPADSPLNSR